MIIGIANIIGCKNTSGTSNPPVSTSDPVISGINVVGQTLSCTDGTWTGSLPITFTYQWKRNGLDILGATSSTYVLVQADAANTISCVVTATNVVGSANAPSSNSFIILDANAQAFLTAASITDTTITTAINDLCVSLKANNLWTKMYAIYPFVGGTAFTHKWNLKNPLNTNAAYRLTFNGGWTHSTNGILGNGTNSYANTHLDMNVLPQSNASLTVYCRTNTTGNRVEMGIYYTTIGFYSLLCARLTNNFQTRLNSGATDALIANTDSRGFFQVYRDDATNLKNKKGTATPTSFARASVSNGGFTFHYFIGDLNFNSSPLGYYTNREYAFASLGEGYTDTDAANLYTIIQAFQTTLSRQV